MIKRRVTVTNPDIPVRVVIHDGSSLFSVLEGPWHSVLNSFDVGLAVESKNMTLTITTITTIGD